MYEFVIDEDGILISRTRGCWSVQLAKAYRDELLKLLNERRASHGQALLLVDGRDSVDQADEVRAVFSDFGTELLCGDRDRSAYIVPSSLAKVEMKKLIHDDRSQCFLSENAAKTWLLAGRIRGAVAA